MIICEHKYSKVGTLHRVARKTLGYLNEDAEEAKESAMGRSAGSGFWGEKPTNANPQVRRVVLSRFQWGGHVTEAKCLMGRWLGYWSP